MVNILILKGRKYWSQVCLLDIPVSFNTFIYSLLHEAVHHLCENCWDAQVLFPLGSWWLKLSLPKKTLGPLLGCFLLTLLQIWALPIFRTTKTSGPLHVLWKQTKCPRLVECKKQNKTVFSQFVILSINIKIDMINSDLLNYSSFMITLLTVFLVYLRSKKERWKIIKAC